MTGASAPDWLKTGFDHIWLPYTQMQGTSLPIAIERTEDSRLILADGRHLIDGCASWWTACHGYNHPHIIAAIRNQLETMPHVMFGGLANEPAYRLAERLAALAPGDLSRVFLAESGSVSVEVAMKIAMQYWINQGVDKRKSFVCFRHAYHGDTLGTMSICDPEEGMHTMFKGALLEQHVLELPVDQSSRDAFSAFIASHSDELAAVIVEPLVQGAGGFRFHDEECLQFIREITARNDTLLIFDEIMTGFGRTGAMFAADAAEVTPDIMTLSKALTGGTMPLSACICTEEVARPFFSGNPDHALMHGPTFMGHAMGCAAANASLDLFDSEPRIEQVRMIERHFNNRLTAAQNIPGVADIRIRGAIGVIEVREMRDLGWLKSAFIESGVFIRPFGNVIYATPPFTISEVDLATLTDVMTEVTRAWSRRQNF